MKPGVPKPWLGLLSRPELLLPGAISGVVSVARVVLCQMSCSHVPSGPGDSQVPCAESWGVSWLPRVL